MNCLLFYPPVHCAAGTWDIFTPLKKTSNIWGGFIDTLNGRGTLTPPKKHHIIDTLNGNG